MAQKHIEPKQDVSGFNSIVAQWEKNPGLLLEGSASHSTSQFISIHNLIKFLRADPPKEGTDERKVYDRVVKSIGDGNGVEQAIYALQLLHGNLLENLSTKVTSRATIGQDTAAELLPILLEISNNERIDAYTGAGKLAAMATLFTNLSRVNDAAEPGTASIEFPNVHAVGTTSSTPYITLNTMDPKEKVVVTTSGQDTVAEPQTIMTDQLIQAVGGPANADKAGEFLGASAQAARSLAPNMSGSDRQTAANRLLTALDPFESNAEINYAPGDPDSPFRAAQAALRNGDIEGALTALSQINDLSTAFSNLHNISVVTVEPKALNRIYGGVTVSLRLANAAEWEEARANPTSAKFMGATRFDVGFQYARVGYQGTQKTFEIEYPDTVDDPTTPVDETKRRVRLNPNPTNTRELNGQGNDYSLPLAFYLSGITKNRNPYHFILSTQPGIRTWQLSKVEVDVVIPETTGKDGTKIPARIEKRIQDLKSTAFFLGPTGIEFNLPGKTGYETFRVSGFGAYVTGTSDSPNFVDNISIFGKIQGAYPGASSGFAMFYSARVDAGVRIPTPSSPNTTFPLTFRAEPVSFVFRRGDHIFMFGPTGELVTEITTERANRFLLSGALGGTLSYLFKDKLEVNLRAGAGVNEGSYKATDWTPYVGLNLTIPWDIGGSKVVPSRVSESREISQIYATAVTFSQNPTNLLSSAIGEAIARKTAVNLAQTISLLSNATEINADPNCQAALLLLNKGDFIQGFQFLQALAEKFPDTFNPRVKRRGGE